MSRIRQLSNTTINRIAAGEVIERPASAVKELVENAIDAGATRVEIVTAAGGKSLLQVSDNGAGMTRDDLVLAIERHATSKLREDDLFDIRTLGFRGEALPSIGSVARLSITTRHAEEPHAWELIVEGGERTGPRPAALNAGTRVEVRDLFFATPARLKFLKSDRAEANAITDVIKRLAMAHPDIHFTLTGSDRSRTDYPVQAGPDQQLHRLTQIMGKDFRENALALNAEREGIHLSGFVGLPTLNRANSLMQFLFVNGRPVRDKLLLGAIRGAYRDFLSSDRHPLLALFIDLAPKLVDVNVHPAKADVRFRDSGLVRGLLVGAIKRALTEAGHRSSSTGGLATLATLEARNQPGMMQGGPQAPIGHASGAVGHQNWAAPMHAAPEQISGMADGQGAMGFAARPQATPAATGSFAMMDQPSADPRSHDRPVDEARSARPLGAARAQFHENYILAQTDKGIVIIDQHAAHERLVYEKLKAQVGEQGIARQLLLIPEVIDLTEEDASRIEERAADLEKAGLVVERFGPGAIVVRETPALLAKANVQTMMRDLADELAEWDKADSVQARVDYVLATLACHGSVRSGRKLSYEEMDHLLREMEATPHSGQCNHGRPTYVELSLHDIERLFGRR